jgi:hypothetical protein
MAFFQKWQEGQYRGDYPIPAAVTPRPAKAVSPGNRQKAIQEGCFHCRPRIQSAECFSIAIRTN